MRSVLKVTAHHDPCHFLEKASRVPPRDRQLESHTKKSCCGGICQHVSSIVGGVRSERGHCLVRKAGLRIGELAILCK